MTPSQRAEDGKSALRYRIVRPLGKGGMGEVFLAEDTILQRKVALKFLTADLNVDSSGRQALLREARVAARLEHPYICQVHEVGESDSRQFIAMEFVEGTTLREKIAAGPLPLDQALQIAGEIAEALDAAHRGGTIHRDLKPANVMLSLSGHVKVMDFGLAQRITAQDPEQAETITVFPQPECIAGTPAYMSPEQLRKEPLDARSDLFALGVILYEMVTGKHPFQRATAMDAAVAVLKDRVPPISEVCAQAPPAMCRLVERLLVKERDQRYSNTREVLDDLAALRAQGPSSTVAKALASRRSALVLLCLAAGGPGVWWLYRTFAHPGQTVLAFRPRDWILIPNFENQTGEDVFNESLDTALTVGIEQSKYVNVFPHSRIPETLRRMGREPVQRVDEKTGSEVALREGIRGLLVCSIARVGDTYALTARLVNPVTQMTALTVGSRAANRNEVLKALDDLAKQIRKKLGESLSGMAVADLPLPRATTESLEALKLFAASRRRNGARNARTLLEEAVQLDPDFALAHADLGVAYYLVDNRPLGEQHFQKALSLLTRLTLREQLWIRALVEDWRGDRDGAIGQYEAFVAQYPDFFDGWFRLGWTRMITRRYESAIDAFRKALEIDPQASGPFINIATAWGALGNRQEAVRNYQKAFTLRPDEIYGPFVNHEYGFVLAAMGDVAKAEQTFRLMLGRDATAKARGHRSLALLKMYRGRYSAAVPDLKEAILLDQTVRAASSELRDRLFLVRLYRIRGMTADSETELKAAGRLYAASALSPDWAVQLGKIYARSGQINEAAQVLQKAERSVDDTIASSPVNRDSRRDRALIKVLKGEVELARSKSAHAADVLELAYRIFQDPSTLEPLAHALRQLGRTEDAVRMYRELEATPHLGSEAQEEWVLAHYQLGRIFQQTGDLAKAKESYERFLEIWKEGDPDLPVIVDAKARLSDVRS